MKPIIPVVVCVLLLMVSPLAACLWDLDTIKMETERFPGTLELITGKFLRHSKPFYEWRILDRQKRIAESAGGDESVAALYDDLAVAQEKTGNTAAAIDTMLKKEELWPGLYTTQANLGTFYIHNGELQKGLEHIERAIEINPDAHFGREVYQKLLVEYVLSKQVDGETVLPLARDPYSPSNADGFSFGGFAAFVLEQQGLSPQGDGRNAVERQRELQKALQGVQGMMHFGNYRSPVLLEALADLLLTGGPDDDARLLACRALLAASYAVEDSDVRKHFRRCAENSLAMQTPPESKSEQITLDKVEAAFQAELAGAEKWFEQLSDDESTWISRDQNPEKLFAEKYTQSDKPTVAVSGFERLNRGETDTRIKKLATFIAGIAIFVAVSLGVAAIRIIRSIRSKHDAIAPGNNTEAK